MSTLELTNPGESFCNLPVVIPFHIRAALLHGDALPMRCSFKQMLGLHLNRGMNVGIESSTAVEEELEAQEEAMGRSARGQALYSPTPGKSCRLR